MRHSPSTATLWTSYSNNSPSLSNSHCIVTDIKTELDRGSILDKLKPSLECGLGTPHDFSVSPGPLGSWFGTKGLGHIAMLKHYGTGLDNLRNDSITVLHLNIWLGIGKYAFFKKAKVVVYSVA